MPLTAFVASSTGRLVPQRQILGAWLVAVAFRMHMCLTRFASSPLQS